MPDLVPINLGSLYGVIWLGVARLAVGSYRVIRRDRASKQMMVRLWRWRHC